MVQWGWWIRNIIHIETIFFVIGIIVIIYLLWTNKKLSLPTFNFKKGEKIKKEKKIQTRKHESKCRKIFEKIFGCEFKTVRPDWLENPITGHNLELDGYNANIITPVGKGLAFEYNGIQHSEYTKHYHSHGVKEFEYQVKKDVWKELKCKERNIMLITIPYYINYNNLEDFIEKKLREKGFQLPKQVSHFSVLKNITSLYG